MKIRDLVNTHRENACETEYGLTRQCVYAVALLQPYEWMGFFLSFFSVFLSLTCMRVEGIEICGEADMLEYFAKIAPNFWILK